MSDIIHIDKGTTDAKGSIFNYEKLFENHNLYLEEGTAFEDSYERYILNKRNVWEKLDKITEASVKNIIIAFLKDWKIRNTDKIDVPKLTKTLRELSKYFKALALNSKSLLSIDFESAISIDKGKRKIKEVIREIWKKLDGVPYIGSTSISKIMHGANTNLFIMWDKKIKGAYGYAGNEIGYLKFCKEVKSILKKIEIGNLPKSYSILKLFDEYNYMKFTKNKELPDPREFSL
jgi:hypothetical protein